MGTLHFEIYLSGNQWRWRLRASNGLIIADSGESYVNLSDCRAAIEIVQHTTLATPVKEPNLLASTFLTGGGLASIAGRR